MPGDSASFGEQISLFAALADAEILRREVAAAEGLLNAEQTRSGDLLRDVESLRARLKNGEERQRELHVLLLHRDEEISRLHEYLAQLQAQPASPELPSPAPEAPPLVVSEIARRPGKVRGELGTVLSVAVDWWTRFNRVTADLPTRRRRRPPADDRDRRHD